MNQQKGLSLARPGRLLLLLSLSACVALGLGCSPSRVPGFQLVDNDGGPVVSDPSCSEARYILPETTCGSERPDVVCAGSCAQTLDGIVGVGLSTCRCIDSGSGFGGQWECDTSACDEGAAPDDAGVADSGVPPADTGTGDTSSPPVCPPATFDRPTAPGCSSAQYWEFTSIESQTDYDRFVADSANDECNACISTATLACATALGCDAIAGELMCCLDAACGEDVDCRNRAFTGACAAEADGLNRCVASVSACALNPAAPPSECFP